jgi:hypothetical protein
MAAQDTASLVLSFQSFRTQVGQRFYRVDRILKGLCEELRKVGSPLAAVLEVAA